MNSTNERGFLQEIEEEMHRQRLKAFWERWGVVILACAALIVLATAAGTFWKSYQVQAAQTLTQAYATQLGQTEKRAETLTAFAKTHAGTSQAALAQLQAAGDAMRAGDREAALKIYDSMIADKTQNPLYRDLAQLLYVQTALDTGDKADLEKRLQPLMKEGPWRLGAQELAGHLALASGDRKKAREIFTTLAASPDLPRALQDRVKDMTQWLKDEGA